MKYFFRTVISLILSIIVGTSVFIAYVYFNSDNYEYIPENKNVDVQDLLNIEDSEYWSLMNYGSDQNKKDTANLIAGKKFSSLKFNKSIWLLLFGFNEKSYLNSYISEYGCADIHLIKNRLYIVRTYYTSIDDSIEVYTFDDKVEGNQADYIDMGNYYGIKDAPHDEIDYWTTYSGIWLHAFKNVKYVHSILITLCVVIFAVVTAVQVLNDTNKYKKKKKSINKNKKKKKKN